MKNKGVFLLLTGVILLCVIIVTVSIVAMKKHEENRQFNTYESDIDEMSVDYDDDNDRYDVFIFEENRHIFIPRSKSEIIICDDDEIIVIEEILSWGSIATIYFYIDPYNE